MILIVTLDAGINVYSKINFEEKINADEWDSMSEQEQEEYIKDIALQNVTWHHEIK